MFGRVAVAEQILRLRLIRAVAVVDLPARIDVVLEPRLTLATSLSVHVWFSPNETPLRNRRLNDDWIEWNVFHAWRRVLRQGVEPAVGSDAFGRIRRSRPAPCSPGSDLARRQERGAQDPPSSGPPSADGRTSAVRRRRRRATTPTAAQSARRAFHCDDFWILLLYSNIDHALRGLGRQARARAHFRQARVTGESGSDVNGGLPTCEKTELPSGRSKNSP